MAKQTSKTKTKTKTKAGKKTKTVQPMGRAYIFSGYNNTIITITDLDGNTICWGSAGNNNFKGSRKSTPFAATIVGENTAKDAVSKGVQEVSVVVKGVGSGKTQAVKALRNGGLVINKLIDATPFPHNGCRPRKRRRN